MSGLNQKTRITYKAARPNPLFLQWLQELQTDAAGRGSNSQYSMKEAIKSLKKYPIPLKSGGECAILKGFGKKLCAYLDHKLQVHRKGESTEVRTFSRNDENAPPAVSENIEHVPSATSVRPQEASNKPKKANRKRDTSYKPAHRSGGCAILFALLEHVNGNPPNLSLTKDDIIEKAQPLCEESLTRPKPGTHYTAWASMTRLVSKGLVNKVRRKKVEFSLTDEGYLLATQLYNEYKHRPVTIDIMSNDFGSFDSGPSTSTSKSSQDFSSQQTTSSVAEGEIMSDIEVPVEIIIMPADSFDIVLLIDKQETSGATRKNDPTVAQFNKYDNLKHEYRHLKVGDFTWVARHRSTGRELVLPYIIERKRMDDLGSSIKDGRFHEQKFRLKKCGLGNVMYLIENYGKNKHVGLPLQSLMQAIANTRVQNGFKVHTTDSLAGSVRFLAIMTKRLTVEYKDKELRGRNADSSDEYLMTFEYFNKSSSKTKPLTVTEAFIKMLLQLRGMSVEKAVAITDTCSTPKSLMDRYKFCSQKEGESLLAKLKYDDMSRNVGPTISKALYKLFTSDILQ